MEIENMNRFVVMLSILACLFTSLIYQVATYGFAIKADIVPILSAPTTTSVYPTNVVANPSQTSFSIPLGVTVSAPTITNLSPSAIDHAGTNNQYNFRVYGTGFVCGGVNASDNSVVLFKGVVKYTYCGFNGTYLVGQLSVQDSEVGGSFPVQVRNPNGVLSNSVNLVINNPGPTITSISPSSVPAGSSTTFTITGTGFTKGSIVGFYINGPRPAGSSYSYISSTQLSLYIPGSSLKDSQYDIWVNNPAPGGGTDSESISVTGIPKITSISPAQVTVGSPGFTLTVNGTGFMTGATVWINIDNTPTSQWHG